jgi:cobalt-zinc-cadmium efflux system protein
MGAEHDHNQGIAEGQNERPLWWALGLTTAFLIAEVVGGILTNSLALIADAAHMFTDTAALAISLTAIRIGRRPADTQRTFGYYRFEILAATVNAVLLFLVALYILYEAWNRFRNPPDVKSEVMLVIAALGLIVNLISMRLLSAGKDKSLNIKGAYLEVWSDMLGSAGVILGAGVIWFTGWIWVDTVIAVAIGLWVLPRTWILLKHSLNILLEGVPEEIGLEQVEAKIRDVPGVEDLHDLHVWAISSGKPSLTVHVVNSEPLVWPGLLDAIRQSLSKDFDIHHVTVQLEAEPCDHGGGGHSFQPPRHRH